MKKQLVLILLAVILFGISADTCNAAQRSGGSAAASRRERMPELRSVDQFKEAFQKDAGKVRLVALVSPT
jgi:hypothetical protein